MPPKRKHLTLEQKKQLIADKDAGKSTDDFVKKFGISKTTVNSTYAKKGEILGQIEDGADPKKKHVKLADNPIDDTTLSWFKTQRSKNVPISGPLIQEKTLQFAEELGNEKFKASDGWLTKFKKRNSITFKSVQGEEGAVNVGELTDWQTSVLCEELDKYAPKDVFNLDETGLFWKLLPNKTMAFKGERCTAGKKSKERLTVVVGANMSGTEKLPLLVIGKSAKPRCFKNAEIPVKYTANKKAWMTSVIFEDYLKKWDRRLQVEQRQIILFVDNCPSHPNIDKDLKNIRLKFFPPNTTSKSQPMDQGVIQNLKIHYRRRFLKKLIKSLDRDEELKMDVLKVLWLLHRAWNAVTSETIANCFRHAKFVRQEEVFEEFPEAEDQDIQEDWVRIQQNGQAGGIELDQFLTVDEELATAGEQILTDFIRDQPEVLTPSDEEEESEVVEPPPISIAEASKALDILQSFMEQNAGYKAVNLVDKLEEELDSIRMQRTTQSKISDFLH